MLATRIAGLGTYLPERRVTNAELEERLDIPTGWIERVTGVQERRYADGESTLSMGASAARVALAAAGLHARDLDLIVGACTAPQQAIPCTAVLMQRDLGAPEGASTCFDLNATCLSFLFALHTVSHLIAAGTYRTALIFCSELASRSLNLHERESAVLFGDAAAAAVVTASAPGEASVLCHARFETYSSGADLTQIVGGGTNHHPNDPATTAEMNTFHMDGPAIFRQASRLMEPFLERFMEPLGWRREEVDALVPHQASRHGVEQISRRLGFRPDQVILNLPRRGNCIAASIPLALTEAVDAGRIRRGNRVLLAGTGAGLTLGAVGMVY
jgi:3-oxoacyl-[acyl-carrier-protein] synthase-3